MTTRPTPPRLRLAAAIVLAAAACVFTPALLRPTGRSTAAALRTGPRQQASATRTLRAVTPTSSPTPVPATPVARPDIMLGAVEVADARHDPQTLTITATFRAAITNTGALGADGPISVTWFADTNRSLAFEPGSDTPLASAVVPAGLGPGATLPLTASGGGRLPFRDAAVWAEARASGPVGEADVVNNAASTAALCRRAPPAGPGAWATPRLKWRWPSPAATPAAARSLQVEAAPVVVDLDGDGGAEVVFATLDPSTVPPSGVLRAVDGRTGRDRFAVVDPSLRVTAYGAPAAGDLAGDGAPELVAVDTAVARVLAFTADGAPLWQSRAVLNKDDALPRLAGPALADLDADGWPEILIDDVLLDAAGGRLGAIPPNALAVDLDLMGLDGIDADPPRPEIVGHGMALAPRLGGRWFDPLWRFDEVDGAIGFSAVANLDDDPYAEIVVIGDNGEVRVLHHNGAPFGPPWCFARDRGECSAGQGGPPVLADFNGDGTTDIGVAGRSHFSASSANGARLWQLETNDTNSGRTSAAAFDFDGDGASEIVYADFALLRIIDGRTGNALWSTARPSFTSLELPVIADVDADGHADVVVGVGGTDGTGKPSPASGLAVYDNPAWAPARPVWNQHAFAHAFVDDAGRIPRVAAPTWQLRNGFRDAGLPGAPAFGQPDLTVGRLVRDATAPPTAPRVIARVGNAGSAAAGRGITVAFHADALTGTLVASATLRAPLPAGAFADVSVAWPPEVDTIAVVVDPDGRVAECAGGWRSIDRALDAADPRTNNVHIARLAALPRIVPTASPSATPTRAPTPTIGPTLTSTFVLPWDRTPSPTPRSGTVTPPTGTASRTASGPDTATPDTATPDTATPDIASPTPTPSTTSTAPSAETATPSPTVARTPATLWLPVALLGRCGPGDRPVDAVLVIDTSAHMAERDDVWRRLDLAKAAASGVLHALAEGTDDRAAVVTAGDVAALRAPFGRPMDLLPVVDGLAAERATSPATPIDRALALARGALEGSRPAAATLIVLISDGRAWPAQTAPAAAEARAAEAAGAVVVALGVGLSTPDVLPPLVAIAGSRRRVRLRSDAPGGEGRGGWAATAGRCPPGTVWAGR